MSVTRRSLAVGLLAPLAAMRLSAQTPCSPQQYNVSVPKSGNDVTRMHPQVSRTRYAALVDSGKWVDAMGAVAADAARAFRAAGVQSSDSGKFMHQVDEVIRALQSLPNDGTRAAFINATVRSVRFAPIRDAAGQFSVFVGPDEINVAPPYPTRQAEAVCWSAMSADAILFRLNLPLEPAAIQLLRGITTSWMNYRSYGYSRQPIELFLQRGSLRDTLPPRGQLIVAHVSAGGEIVGWGGRLDSLSANQTMIIELLGGLRYWHDYTRYAGLSGIVAVASDRPLGAGALVHLGPGLRGGVVWRREAGATRTSALLSFDLYGLFDRSKLSVENGFNAARSLVLLRGRGER
jgi:hypothetical protein